jgi:hypothetical protein
MIPVFVRLQSLCAFGLLLLLLLLLIIIIISSSSSSSVLLNDCFTIA